MSSGSGRSQRQDGAATASTWVLAGAPRIEHWLGVAADRHDLETAATAAQEAEEWLCSAEQASTVASLDCDPITLEPHWSAECKTLFGFPPERMVTDELFLACIQSDEQVDVLAVTERAFDPAGSGEYRSVYRALRGDGTERWVDARGRAIFGEVAGLRRAIRSIGTALHITSDKQAECRHAPVGSSQSGRRVAVSAAAGRE